VADFSSFGTASSIMIELLVPMSARATWLFSLY
jgi:hypothetical protein